MAVVGAWIKLFPDLWRMDSFEDAERFAAAPISTSPPHPASENR
jgi:hypothetical protein